MEDYISFRCPGYIKEDIRKMAEAEDRTISKMVKILVEEAIANRAYDEEHPD